MRQQIVVIPLLLALASISSFGATIKSLNGNSDCALQLDSESSDTAKCELTIAENFPPYFLKIKHSTAPFRYDPDNSSLGSFDLVIATASSFLPTLQTFSDLPVDMSQFRVDSEDVNFDGYADLKVLIRAGSNRSDSHYWTFSPGEGKLQYRSDLAKICCLSVDAHRKVLKSHEDFDTFGSFSAFYRWNGDLLGKFKEEKVSQSGKQYLHETIFYEGGKQSRVEKKYGEKVFP